MATTRRGLFGIALLSLVQSSPPTAVSVVYRGQPVTVPRAEDLAAIRAAGFTSVSWPFVSLTNVAALTQLARAAGLSVNLAGDLPAMTLDSAAHAGESAAIPVSLVPSESIAALTWRAIAHGTRLVAYDPGLRGGGALADSEGRPPAWLAAASGIARQLQINGALFARSRPGPAVTIDPPPPASLDVVLLDAARAWILVATNTASSRARAAVRLPADVPYGLWLNLVDGSTMGMLSQPDGPRWTVDLEGGGFRIYVIDKTLK